MIGYLLGSCRPTFYADGPVALVDEVAVVQGERGRGTGRSLMTAFERWAVGKGAVLVDVPTRRAAAFYRSLGYDETATVFRRRL